MGYLCKISGSEGHLGNGIWGLRCKVEGLLPLDEYYC